MMQTQHQAPGGGLGTPDVGSLVERIHTKAVRLSISILVSYFLFIFMFEE